MTDSTVRVTALFVVEPAAPFGLPDGSRTVVPASTEKPAQIYSPLLDSRSGQLVSHGTLSAFRADDQAIHEKVTVGDADIHFTDNFVTVEVDAPTLVLGVEIARTAVIRLLRQLMVQQGEFFRAVLVQYEAVGDKTHLAASPTKLMDLATYNLDELRGRIRRAAQGASHSDDRLDRGLLYYEHARFLFKLSNDAGLAERHRDYLNANSFLFLWKAITAVLGEPGTDRDYQRRYREFGLPADYWKTTVQPLKELRDAADVAHYELDSEAIKKPVAAYGRAEGTCREVLKAYSDFLLHKRDSDSGPEAT